MALLIKDCACLPMLGPGIFYPRADILIDGEEIAAVMVKGSLTEPTAGTGDGLPVGSEQVGGHEALMGPRVEVLEAAGYLALPGLVNCHTHSPMSLFRGYADDLPLKTWLEERIWPLEAELTSDDVYWGAQLSILEMLESGTTAFADMYDHMDRVAEVVSDSGMRACLARGLIGVNQNACRALREASDLVRIYQGAAEGRIEVRLGPHAPYTCPPSYLRRVLELAHTLGVGIHTHLAETAGEVQEMQARYGKTPVKYLHDLEVFTVPVLAAHCVHLDREDMELLQQGGVAVAHCPESNLKLASGVAPLTDLLAGGLAVGLGTDGPASNNNLDLFEELRLAAFLQKNRVNSPEVITAYQALELATVQGARALGWEERIGTIAPGRKADIILLKWLQPHFYPRFSPAAAIAFAGRGSDVHSVIVNGRVLLHKGEALTIDRERVFWEVDRRASRFS